MSSSDLESPVVVSKFFCLLNSKTKFKFQQKNKAYKKEIS